MIEPLHPMYDAFCDSRSQDLENLHLDERFVEWLEARAKVKSTTVRFNEPLVVERDFLPATLTEAVYFPGKVIVEGFAAQFTQYPQHDVWALDVRCTINDAPYFVNSSAKQTVVDTEDVDGNKMSIVLPSDTGADFVTTFMKIPHEKNNAQELLSRRVVTTNTEAFAELLFELGNRFGYVVKEYDTEIDQFDEVCRALSVKLMTYESTDESSTKLTLDGAIDLGTEPTRFSFSQLTSSDPDTPPKESVSIGPSRIPIENYLVMRAFELDSFPAYTADQSDVELMRLKTRLAPLLMTTLETLIETTEEEL